MSKSVRLPKLSLSMEEGTIVNWTVPLQQPIAKDEVIAEIETDKAVIELQMPYDGVIESFLVEAGATVAVGEPIALLKEEGNEKDAVSAENGKPLAEPQQRRTFLAISPSARRRARELEIDYSLVKGSGPNGRILHRDIENAKGRLPCAVQEQRKGCFTPSSTAASSVACIASSAASAVPQGRKLTLSSMRRTIARRMLDSVQTVPQFAITRRVDVSNMMKIKSTIQNSLLRKKIKLSLTDFMIRAVAETLVKYPALNASFIGHPGEEGCHIVEHEHVNVGLAVSLDGGLMVPVIHETERLSVSEIAMARVGRIDSIRNRTSMPSHMQGGTVTISNLGAYGVEQFQAIVNPPEGCILAVGAVKDVVVSIAGKMEIRPMMNMTGSFDHRLIDGAPAAEFMNDLVRQLESDDWYLI
ncbi:dihydrolipoamide acetyltransferase family protein [Paenibacillus contaminans]|uniref:Dihydrolipoamide acetyltransferase component of pyruvate dehydrogenase complex n=1 Tax=Paenibacillus contaminans TaxID=450362 RepID=A0A329MKJ3_9BACL|nr:dihydrolipoamide acetyltransferase family protein [Paenibacillus contaminans]RAV19233.1 hypothetical protein DQG23_22110 [Paenibacillus contaminans]